MLLKKGSIGQEVTHWQRFLFEKGFLNDAIDGIFGKNTETATKAWQNANGLEDDGEVGANSFTKAKSQGYQHSPEALWYPPRPDFESPTQADSERLFGKFEFRKKANREIEILGGWVANNIVKVKIPQLIGVIGAPANGEIRFHKKGAAQLQGLFEEIEKQGFKDLIISFAGSFYPRLRRPPATKLSNHSWGSSFDINAPENWLNQPPAPVGKRGSLLKIVPIANSFGFYWGGHYRSRLDGMHFELAVLDRFPN